MYPRDCHTPKCNAPTDSAGCYKNVNTSTGLQFPGPCTSLGGHAYSTDGKQWYISPVAAYNASTVFEDNTVVTWRARERPHMILDGDGEPVAFLNGVGDSIRVECSKNPLSCHCKGSVYYPCPLNTGGQNVWGPGGDHAFTLIQPLGTKHRLKLDELYMATIKTDDVESHGTISLDPNGTAIARMPATHAGLIMEGVNHALYGYGLGSQMVFGEGFEEPSITDCTDNAPCHGPFPEQWSVIGGNASLTSTKAEVFTGKQALRVDGEAQLLNAGLHRLGISSTQGWAYEASFFYQYKADPTPKLASTLTVVLRTNEQSPKNLTAVSLVLAPTGGQWQRVNVTLPAASRSFPNCSLAIQIDGSSVLHVDAVLLEPLAEHRWQGMHIRNDIAEAINAAGLRFMRFGGDMAESSEPLPFGYTWANQIGNPQRRPPKLGGAWYAWDSFGFGIFEVLEMIEKMGFGTDRQGSWGVMITLNYRVETPESCALFAEYCFGGSDTKGGRMRIANGRSDPYKPFFVEIGNEQHGSSIQPYLKIFSAQVDAMMAVTSAKGKLKYLVGTSILTTYPDSDIRALFDYCQGKPCGYDWHIGLGNHSDIASQLQGKVDSLQALQQLYQRMGTNRSEFVTIIGEENCDHWPTVGAHPGCHSPSAYYQDHMWGVALNRALEHAAWSNALQSPLGSMILASNPSSATGSWYTHMSNDLNPNGPKIGALWLSANIQYTPTAVVVQPPMHAQSMIGHSQLPNVLHVQRSSTLPSVNFSIVALASDDYDRLTIRVVNLNATAVNAVVAIAGGSTWSGTSTQLSGKLDGHNSPEQPFHVVPTKAPVTAGQLAAGLEFEPHSFTVLNLTRLKTDDGDMDQYSEEQLSLQTREWWRWVVTRVSNFAAWIEVDGDQAREDFVQQFDPDLFDWAGDGRWEIKEWARLRGIAVAQASGLEYEECSFNLYPNASAAKRRNSFVEDIWGPENGLAIEIDGKPPPTYHSLHSHRLHPESHPFMTHAAPKWSLAVQQSNARAGLVGDAVSQDNACNPRTAASPVLITRVDWIVGGSEGRCNGKVDHADDSIQNTS